MKNLSVIAEAGFEPTSSGHEPDKEPLLYPAILNCQQCIVQAFPISHYREQLFPFKPFIQEYYATTFLLLLEKGAVSKSAKNVNPTRLATLVYLVTDLRMNHPCGIRTRVARMKISYPEPTRRRGVYKQVFYCYQYGIP